MKSDKKHNNKVFSKYSNNNVHPLIRIIKSKSFRLGLSLLFGMLAFITALELFIPHSHDYHSNRIMEVKLSDSIETEVMKISSRFICNCGKCSKDNLVKCKCQDAIKERNMIRSLLTKNVPPVEIIKIINERFSGLIDVN